MIHKSKFFFCMWQAIFANQFCFTSSNPAIITAAIEENAEMAKQKSLLLLLTKQNNFAL